MQRYILLVLNGLTHKMLHRQLDAQMASACPLSIGCSIVVYNQVNMNRHGTRKLGEILQRQLVSVQDEFVSLVCKIEANRRRSKGFVEHQDIRTACVHPNVIESHLCCLKLIGVHELPQKAGFPIVPGWRCEGTAIAINRFSP
jgi:hypothetical protein